MTNEFNSIAFEELMADAVAAHVQGNYETAKDLSLEAYNFAPDSSMEKGRAARDVAARFDRLGYPETAGDFAEEAFDIHCTLVERWRYSPERFRERGASALYLGVLGLRKTFRNKLVDTEPEVGDNALSMFRQAWDDIHTAKQLRPLGIDRWIDQYQINAVRRVSMAESLLGSKSRGSVLGAGAVALAFMSESPRLSTSTPDMSLMLRLKAKRNALLGGVAALGVSALSIARKPTLARKVAARVL